MVEEIDRKTGEWITIDRGEVPLEESLKKTASQLLTKELRERFWLANSGRGGIPYHNINDPRRLTFKCIIGIHNLPPKKEMENGEIYQCLDCLKAFRFYRHLTSVNSEELSQVKYHYPEDHEFLMSID